MGKSNRLAFVYLFLGIALVGGWLYVKHVIWPPPDPPPPPVSPEQFVALVGGGLPVQAIAVEAPRLAREEREAAAKELEAKRQAELEREKKAGKPATPSTLIAMGQGAKPFHLQVLLNTRGGSVQQVVLSDFQQADREGLPVWEKDAEGNDRLDAEGKKIARPLHLLPGVRIPHTIKIRDQREVEAKLPELAEGPVADPTVLEEPSYVMYHYERDGEPVTTLGERQWRVVPTAGPTGDGDSQAVAFETELGAPFYVRIRKTFTLGRDDYHLGLAVSITPWERPAGVRPEPFRYQVTGPHGIPIEGEWYTSTYRQGVVGWPGARALEDPRSVRTMSGSDPHRSADRRPIRYAGVMVQYFASVLAVDSRQADGQGQDILDYVRFTPHGPTHKDPDRKVDHAFLDDLTFRAVSKPVGPDQPAEHRFVLYQGPVKVRLLKQLEGDKAVPEETVNLYRDDLDLRTMTDAPMPNWLGRFANFIFWTDIVIAFTNLIHSLLGLLSHVFSNLGVCIILITFMVRGLLHPFSRRQMINAKVMQAKQEKLAPELKKLTEQYGDDFTRLQQEKGKLYRAHGINPAAAMGGCFLLLAQMPIFMGLYYALQESVFFRLEPFLWMPNLSAPDMLVWWGEGIPFLSQPDDLGGMVYVGPYLNLLPLVAVSLMMYTQSKMMPKSEDPQIQTQQKMMKVMMVLFAFFFYKVAAGLCIYFICSSLWGMVERKLLPKKVKVPDETPAGSPGPKDRPRPAEPKGWLGKKVAGWRERWEKVLEEAQKQQQHQREQRPGPAPRGPQPPPGPGRKKKRR